MTFDISPLLSSLYRELASLERFAFRRDQLLEGIDWSAMTIEFKRNTASDDEELGINIFEINAYIINLEGDWDGP